MVRKEWRARKREGSPRRGLAESVRVAQDVFMQIRRGEVGGQQNDASGVATVVVDGEQFEATQSSPVVFGRADARGVVGLDAKDMGISAIAGSIEYAWAAWWVVNQSTKRPVFLEASSSSAHLRLDPGHRHPILTERLAVLVPGAVATHVVEVLLPASYTEQLKAGDGRLTSGTLVAEAVTLSALERDALAALCAGYLEPFPRRREHPNTYAEAAALLDNTTADKVRKAVERVKDRFANKHALYFEGAQANYDLAAHLVSNGILTGEDLRRLAGRRP